MVSADGPRSVTHADALRRGIADPATDSRAAIIATYAEQQPSLKRGTRFRAFPTRTVRQADGTYVVPVYRVTHVRHFPAETVIYYCDDADSKGRWYASVAHLYANGLEVLPATPKED